MKLSRHFLLPSFGFLALILTQTQSITSVRGAGPIAVEKDGVVTIEAESFSGQTKSDERAWHVTSSKQAPDIAPDGDPAHPDGASGGAYIEVLPDTRRSAADKLINGENFMNKGGEMAVLSYPIQISTPGRYYVWVRAYSTNSEDNGLHFGLDGGWPESGARWQTVKKDGWHWDCKQRTDDVPTGVPMQLWLDIDKAGDHELLMSMREDGSEVDQIILARLHDFLPAGTEPYSAAEEQDESSTGTAVPSAKISTAPMVQPRGPDGDGSVTVGGDLKQWHKVTLSLDGPFAHEQDNAPNPFTDLALNVTFIHESGSPKYVVPGYFAADGDAADSGAQSGTVWRAHFSPDKTGQWTYSVSFDKGDKAALDGGGESVTPFDGQTGSFTIADSDKNGRDFRSKGRLSYVGKHHLQFAGSQEYFLKAGPDAPETLLAYVDFDGTDGSRKQTPRKGDTPPAEGLKTWRPHLRDWREGDPTWRDGNGRGLIGALNYLAGKGVNAFSFLTYNAGGDGDNVWPFVDRYDKLHYDCSKLGQWGMVFDHATAQGLYLHFKLQENEMDDDRRGHDSKPGRVPESLDGGKLGPERKLYCRELIARFGHALALNWNLGEENTQSTDEITDMLRYLKDTDPYQHHRVLHTFPNQQDTQYTPLLGDKSGLTGVSLQNTWNSSHQRTLKWLQESGRSGRPWVVAHDEQNPAGLGVPQDIGYRGTDGLAYEKNKKNENAGTGDVKSKAYTLHDIRKLTLWGNLMAGGAGVEYYFGYALPENDLICEDFRSRDQSWDYCRIALDFFRAEKIPFWEMHNADSLVGNDKNDNSRYCLAKPGEVYLVYLPNGGSTELDLGDAEGEFGVGWFNPRSGGGLESGSVGEVKAGNGKVSLGNAPADAEDDWAIVVRKK